MRTARKMTAVLLAVALLLACAGCSKEEQSSEGGQGSSSEKTPVAPAQKETEDTVYYNSFLGLTVTAPDGFYVTSLNEANLSQEPDQTTDPNNLEWYDYGDGGFGLDLITIWNKRSDTHDDHAEMDVYAEDYADLSGGFDAYWEDFLHYTSYSEESEYYCVSGDTGTAQLHGRSYRTLTRVIGNEHNDVDYAEEYYVTQLGDIYVVIYVNYWMDSAQSKTDAYFLREHCIEFAAAGSQAA